MSWELIAIIIAVFAFGIVVGWLLRVAVSWIEFYEYWGNR